MKEGMGDKIGILCQCIAQFICGLTIAFIYRFVEILSSLRVNISIHFCLQLEDDASDDVDRAVYRLNTILVNSSTSSFVMFYISIKTYSEEHYSIIVV